MKLLKIYDIKGKMKEYDLRGIWNGDYLQLNGFVVNARRKTMFVGGIFIIAISIGIGIIIGLWI